MKRKRGRPLTLGLTMTLGTALLALALVAVRPATGQQMIQEGFEARDPIWVKGPSDSPHKEAAHRLDPDAHSGQRSEYFELQAEPGSYIHYTYDIGRGPIGEDFNASIWVKGNRAGFQLLARVVFPRERDPRNPDQPLTAMLPGDKYQRVGRWEQLRINNPARLLREQQQLLRMNLQREVIVTDAYVDQLLLNLYAGPGETKLWADDMEVGPVIEMRSPTTRGAGQTTARRRPSSILLSGRQLVVDGQRFFLLGIRHSGTPLRVLREAGFNAVWLDETTPSGLIEDAVRLGFLVVPTVHPPGLPGPSGGPVEGQLTSREVFGRKVARFLDQQDILCWDLGGQLLAEQSTMVARTAQAFDAVDPHRPMAADVRDGFKSYTRTVDRLMVGVHRWPLMTTLSMTGYRDFLMQRRRLVAEAKPDTFCWTWIQTHLPDWFTTVAYDRPTGIAQASTNAAGQGPGAAGGEPLGPHPEQIRLLAYTAVGCGYHGLGFWSDRALADSQNGRDRLLALAVLNQEFQMLEPLLVAAKEPTWIKTSHNYVMAAVMRTEKAVLALPVWVGPDSQFVPSQGAVAELDLTVPMVPANSQAWQVSPGLVRTYPCERVMGGVKVTLHDFDLTSAVVFTSDLGRDGLVVRFQEMQRAKRALASQWTCDQAEEELKKALQVNAELEKMGHAMPDGDKLVAKARDCLQKSARHRRDGEYTEACNDAQIAMRTVRVLMRGHWDEATRGLATPVASPYLVSYFTLPRHWQFVEEISRLRPSANVLPDGDFESPPERVPPGWLVEEGTSLDDVEVKVRRVADSPLEGKQCVKLEVAPRSKLLPPSVLERTFLRLNSPAVHLPPGTLVRISVAVRVPDPIKGSPDGAMIFESTCGEPFAVRLPGGTPESVLWKRYTLFRRVPDSGTVNVTLGLSGMGSVFFDDVRIEPLVPGGQTAPPPLRTTVATPVRGR
jgi:hypothetical protein